MLRLLVIGVAVLCFHARNAHGRNETVHACELVVKCFDDADVELMKCQSIVSGEPPGSNAIPGDVPGANETTVEPTTTTAAPTDDCMAAIKVKMQQKRALLEQRAQAFALCLNERMGRGPEDVDPRKFRYCNTVISRYNARTTAPPEFTFGTTTTSVESTQSTQHRLPSSTSVPTSTRRSSQQQLVTFSSPHARGSSPQASTVHSMISSPHPPLGIRPRRQAPGGNLELEATQGEIFAAAAASNGSNGDIIRPPGVSPPGRRSEVTSTSTEPTVTIKTSTPDSIDQQSSTVTGAPKQELPQQPAIPDGPAGRISAVARFSSTGQSPANNAALASKNGTAGSVQSTQSPSLEINTEATPQVPIGPQEAANQTKSNSTGAPQPEQKVSSESASTLAPLLGSATVQSVISAGASLSPINLNGSSPSLNIQQSTPLPDNRTNLSVQIRTHSNDSNGGSPVLVQQQEQAEPGVAFPLDQPVVDAVPVQEVPSAVSPPSAPSSPGVARPGSTTSHTASTTKATSTTAATPASQNWNANAFGTGNADERQRNRAETLRESRRRVSEFKACMARARIKREECKPMVNCCPDSVKCHLRYELSELHDQIHRLELEISEGRQACLEKKKVDDAFVDALDQIDEEDLVSDESIVSQQVF